MVWTASDDSTAETRLTGLTRRQKTAASTGNFTKLLVQATEDFWRTSAISSASLPGVGYPLRSHPRHASISCAFRSRPSIFYIARASTDVPRGRNFVDSAAVFVAPGRQASFSELRSGAHTPPLLRCIWRLLTGMTARGPTLPFKNIKPPRGNVLTKRTFLEVRALQISSNWRHPRFNAAQHAKKKVAGNVPRLSLEAIESLVSFKPFSSSRFANSSYVTSARFSSALRKSGCAFGDLRLCPCKSHFVAAPDKKKSDMTL